MLCIIPAPGLLFLAIAFISQASDRYPLSLWEQSQQTVHKTSSQKVSLNAAEQLLPPWPTPVTIMLPLPILKTQLCVTCTAFHCTTRLDEIFSLLTSTTTINTHLKPSTPVLNPNTQQLASLLCHQRPEQHSSPRWIRRDCDVVVTDTTCPAPGRNTTTACNSQLITDNHHITPQPAALDTSSIGLTASPLEGQCPTETATCTPAISEQSWESYPVWGIHLAEPHTELMTTGIPPEGRAHTQLDSANHSHAAQPVHPGSLGVLGSKIHIQLAGMCSRHTSGTSIPVALTPCQQSNRACLPNTQPLTQPQHSTAQHSTAQNRMCCSASIKVQQHKSGLLHQCFTMSWSSHDQYQLTALLQPQLQISSSQEAAWIQPTMQM